MTASPRLLSLLRRSIVPSGVLATVGVLGAAAALAVVGRLLGLSSGDHVYIFCRHEDAPYVDLLFGRPIQG